MPARGAWGILGVEGGIGPPEAQAQSQIEALTSQVANLKDLMVVQEIELTSASVAQEMAKQGL